MKTRLITKYYTFNGEYLSAYNGYQRHLESSKLSVATKEWRLKHIRKFLYFLQENNMELNKLEKIDIENIIRLITLNSSKRTIQNRAVCIKYFLLYLSKKKKIKISADDVKMEIRKFPTK